MSHAATFGGMCTLIGTSTNLVAHEFALSYGLRGFSIHRQTEYPVKIFVLRKAYTRSQPEAWGRLLFRARTLTMQLGERYLSELIVEPDSAWVGKAVNAEHFERDFDVDLIGVLRVGQALPIGDRDLLFAPYDSLLVRGPLEHILKLTSQNGFELHRPEIFGRLDEKQRRRRAKRIGYTSATRRSRGFTDVRISW